VSASADAPEADPATTGAPPENTNGPKGAKGSEGTEEHASGLRAALVYATMILGGLALLQLVLHLGRGLKGPPPRGGEVPGGGGHGSSEQILWKLLLASAVIIVVARLAGKLFERIHQPQVVGEIVAGIVLGPSLLGSIWPQGTHALFSEEMLPHLDVLAQVGLVFYMFLVGLELDPRLMRGRGHTAATVSHVSIIFPFILGCALALYLFPTLGSESGEFLPFALFLGASMSITAFPVLARILTERGIYKTHLGVVTLTCAAVDDVTAWCLLAVVVAITRAAGPMDAVSTIALSIVFNFVMLFLVRPFLSRLSRYHEERGGFGGGMLAVLFVAILLSALATDRIGIHAIFGAFMLGAIMPHRSEFVSELVGKLEDFTVVFLLPLFFAFTGLRTDIGLLGVDGKLWLATAAVLLVAIVGKWGGSSLAARALKLPWRESMALGILMNTRGLTELIILNIGLDLGVIPPTLFAILVIMALVTTFMATPLLSVFYPRRVVERLVAEAEAGEEKEEAADGRRYTILVPVPTPRASALVDLAIRVADGSEEGGRIILLRVVRPPGSAYRAGPEVQESLIRRAADNLRPLVEQVRAAGHEAVPLAMPGADVAETIVQVAKQREPDLVLMAYHRPLWDRGILHTKVGEVLNTAPADVAVLVDQAVGGVKLEPASQIVVPHGGGFHEDFGLDLALRLARPAGASVSIVGPAGDEKEAQELAVRASRAVEESGVWTVPESVETEPGIAVLERTKQADLVVLGFGDEWARNKESLGGVREAIAAHTRVPILLVRRHRRTVRLRRPKEWIEHDGHGDLTDGHTDKLTPAQAPHPDGDHPPSD